MARVSRVPPIQHRGHQRHEVFFCPRGFVSKRKETSNRMQLEKRKKNLGKKEATLKDVL